MMKQDYMLQQQMMKSQFQSQSLSNSEGIYLIFRKSDSEGLQIPPIIIQCFVEEEVSEVIQRYRTKANENNDNEIFMFNGKQLGPQLTLSQSGIHNDADILVVTKKWIKLNTKKTNLNL